MAGRYGYARCRPFLSSEQRKRVIKDKAGNQRPWLIGHIPLAAFIATCTIFIVGPITAGTMQLGNTVLFISFAIPILSFIVQLYVYFRLKRRGHRNVILDFEDWLLATRDSISSSYSVDEEINRLTYAITVTGDEALWWLRRLTTISNVSWLLWRITDIIYMTGFFLCMSLLVLMPIVIILGGVLDLFSVNMQEHISVFIKTNDDIGIAAVVFLSTIYAGVPILMMLGLGTLLLVHFLFRFHQFSFGEGMMDNILTKVLVNKVPPGRPICAQYHHKISLYSFMRHSRVYEEQGVVSVIAKWMMAC